MKKVGIVLGAAAVAVLAGCKDPNYRGYSSDSQDEVKQAQETPAGVSTVEPVQTIEPAPEPVVAEPAAKKVEPVVEPLPAPEPEPVEETTTYIVQRGDYLAKISKKYNVKISSIRRLNPQIKDDNVVRIGQKIKLPGKIDVGEQKAPTPTPHAKKPAPAVKPYTGATKEYVVKSGDTLGGIAHAYGLRVRQLKELNGLKKDMIRVGQKLKVPAEKKSVAKKTAPKAAPAVHKVEPKPVAAKEEPKAPVSEPVATEAVPAAAPVEPSAQEAVPAPEEPGLDEAATNEISYTVQEGEDLTDISIKFSVSEGEIRNLNNLGDEPLKAGQVLKLPANAVEQQ
ncbi:MAG TPA: hypothetical protein DDY72_01030 [Verrucomicrobia bacterium]|nr:hypothetical protein [Verrucomicrobiota bacterium]